MTHRLADLVEDVTTTYSGTGNVTMAATPPTGKQSPNTLCTVDGDTIDVVLASGSQWEYTRLTRVSSGVYSRQNPPWASSTGSQVSFTSGQKEVRGDVGAFFAEYLNTVEIAVASASTCDIGAAKGSRIEIIGDVAITSFGTSKYKRRHVRFSGSPLITAGSTVVTPTGDSIYAFPGMEAIIESDGTATPIWRVSIPNYPDSHDAEDYLINGNGQVAQRTLGSTADDTYSHDRWYALTQTAALTTSQLTDVEDGVPQMIRLTQGQASAQRIGYAQIIEAGRCKKLRGKTITFGGRLRYSNAAAVRFAILEWGGTADSLISDVVNDWTSGTYTSSNFFIASNYGVRAVGSLTPSANALTDWSLTTTLGSSFNNLTVLVWTEGTAAQNSTLDFVAQVKRGRRARPLMFRNIADEHALCTRFFEPVGAEIVGQCKSSTTMSFVGKGRPKRSAPNITATTTAPGGIEFGVSLRTGSGFAISSQRTFASGAYSADSSGWSSLTAGNIFGFDNNYFTLDAEL